MEQDKAGAAAPKGAAVSQLEVVQTGMRVFCRGGEVWIEAKTDGNEPSQFFIFAPDEALLFAGDIAGAANQLQGGKQRPGRAAH